MLLGVQFFDVIFSDILYKFKDKTMIIKIVIDIFFYYFYGFLGNFEIFDSSGIYFGIKIS